ncbi:hypothetical protein F5Y09DRAFT_177027 [Xylaria sp. FL1042]|nr:hypothetical protein F5Y09DRAFT_177027 [Xylaria sp. FL1042]
MDDSTKKQKWGRGKLPELPTVGNQRKWDITKAVMRTICIILSVVDIGELIAIDAYNNSLDYYPAAAYPVLATLLLWDIVEFVVIIVRGSTGKGVHPGAHVGVELILWLGSIFTIAALAFNANWGLLGAPTWKLEELEITNWVYVALTQFSFLGFIAILRFVFFVRACVEVDRRKKDRRVQQLVLAIQKQGRNPQDVPLSTFQRARDLDYHSASTMIKALSSNSNTSSSHSGASSSTTAPRRPSSAPEERDFAYKYNFTIATVPELLQSGIHPEDARNQKVLIETFPR